MRKVIVAAATAATLATLGLTATAQAQPASHSAGRADPAVSKTVVAGIPAAFTVVDHATSKCTWTVTGLPGPVTAGAGLTNNCTDLIDGVFPTVGTKHITAKATAGGTTTTFTITVTVKAYPGENDAVGVGSDTITPLTDALSGDYNGTVSSLGHARVHLGRGQPDHRGDRRLHRGEGGLPEHPAAGRLLGRHQPARHVHQEQQRPVLHQLRPVLAAARLQ